MTELLLGCGRSRDKRMITPYNPSQKWDDLYTADFNSEVVPDINVDLDSIMWLGAPITAKGSKPLSKPTFTHSTSGFFREDFFDEVHAYEVLEHLGQQGSVTSFFSTFDNIYRILRNGGFLCGTCPSRHSNWLWGDPGHTRAIIPESLSFLDQTNYTQCGNTAMTDYRFIYKSDFKVISSEDDRQTHRFILQAIKPARTA